MEVLSRPNKLVRDHIIDFIQERGETPEYEILEEEQYYKELLEKLIEEANEVKKENADIKEIADVLEVIEALILLKGYTKEQVEEVKQEKQSKNGAFKKRIYLKQILK